jgi:cytochrome c oxidase subunit 2
MSGASNFVQGVDLSLIIILGISVFFLVGITAVMILFVVRYSRKKNPKATSIEGNKTLEIVWTVIPTILVLIMFYYGWAGFAPMRKVPKDAMTVKVYGQMWSWSFEYENGKRSADLVVPQNQAVKLELISRDVIHSLYIPAFRVKEDVVPGKDNFMWFRALELGEYDLFCTEYCGDRHSYMLSKVKVLPQNEFMAWMVTSDVPEGEHPGLTILKQNACTSCHSLDGSKIVGPSFKGLYGKQETVVTDGRERTVTADDEYIRRSIWEPNADLVIGFNPGLMISYKDQVDEEKMQKILDFLKTIN